MLISRTRTDRRTSIFGTLAPLSLPWSAKRNNVFRQIGILFNSIATYICASLFHFDSVVFAYLSILDIIRIDEFSGYIIACVHLQIVLLQRRYVNNNFLVNLLIITIIVFVTIIIIIYTVCSGILLRTTMMQSALAIWDVRLQSGKEIPVSYQLTDF